MALPDALEALCKTSSGLGVDENSVLSSFGKSDPEQRKSFRKASSALFVEDERSFERWNDDIIELLEQEFLRFKNTVVLWVMHPWERDARSLKEALKYGPSYREIVEIACTRSSEELLGARKAYHSLFDHSIEEEVATLVRGSERKLLVALVSAYRYDGPKIKEDVTKAEAKTLSNAFKNGDKKTLVEDEEVIRILATRSKHHLRALYKHYNEVPGASISEDLAAVDLILKETVECLCTPIAYFSKVVDDAMRDGADLNTKRGLTRVIVSRADVDLKEIQEEYKNSFKVPLYKKIEETAKGHYKDCLLSLITRDD